MALSDAAVRALKPREKPYKVHDRDGLFLLVNANGSKLWRWRYRFDHKEKLMALGEYPTVSLVQAREGQFAAGKVWPLASTQLLAMQVISRIRQKFAIECSASSNF